MRYSIEYFHPRVLAEIEAWPPDILADYARILKLLMEHGSDLRLPYSRAFGKGLFELRPRGQAGIGRAFYCWRAARRCAAHLREEITEDARSRRKARAKANDRGIK